VSKAPLATVKGTADQLAADALPTAWRRIVFAGRGIFGKTAKNPAVFYLSRPISGPFVLTEKTFLRIFPGAGPEAIRGGVPSLGR